MNRTWVAWGGCCAVVGAVSACSLGQYHLNRDAGIDGTMADVGADRSVPDGGGMEMGVTDAVEVQDVCLICSATCIDPRTDPTNCGACGAPCAPGGCTASHCTNGCAVGYEVDPVSGFCDVTVPRPIAPLALSTITTGHPVFHWSGTAGAIVEIGTSRDFTTAQAIATVNGTGSSAMLTAVALPPGLYFYRLHGVLAGTTSRHASPTWQFRVQTGSGQMPGAPATTFGSNCDFDNDGASDLVVSSQNTGGTPPINILTISRGGPSWSTTQATATLPANPTSPASIGVGLAVACAGDVNGDGYADLAASSTTVGGASIVNVYLGGLTGIADGAPPSLVVTAPLGRSVEFGMKVARAGDLDGDGYGDLLISNGNMFGGNVGDITIYWGGPGGPSSGIGTAIITPGDAIGQATSIGDVDNDGYWDIVLADENGTTPGLDLLLGSSLRSRPATVLVSSVLPPISGADAAGGFSGICGAGDVDGDGHPDLVSGNAMLAAPQGVVFYTTNSSGVLRNGFVNTDPSGYNPVARDIALLGDVDGDGLSEVAIGDVFGTSGSGQVLILRPGRTQTIVSIDAAAMGRINSNVVFGGDVNADGHPDLAFPGAFGPTNSLTATIWVVLSPQTYAPGGTTIISGLRWGMPSTPAGLTGWGSTIAR